MFQVAVKSVRVRHAGDRNEVEQINEIITQEAAAWAKSPHRNILPLYGIIPYFRPLPAFMSPWMADGSLTEYLRREFSSLSQSRKSDIVSPLFEQHDCV